MSDEKPPRQQGQMLYEIRRGWERFWALSTSWKVATAIGAIAVLAIAISLVTSSDDDGTSTSTQASRPGNNVENSLEYKLAVVNEGGFVAEDDPSVTTFARLLDGLNDWCNESRQKIADMAVLANDSVTNAGIRESLRQTMQGVHDSVVGTIRQPCADIFAAWVVLRTS